MKKHERILGVLGGMGTYAGLNFVNNFLKEWQAIYQIKKEWDYPHFILDNNCKLPSRVRHILYKEKSPLSGMIKSIKKLKNAGANVVVIPCNTAHYFLGRIRDKVNIEVLDMIDLLFKYLKQKKIRNIHVLASEGTILANLYGGYNKNIKVKYAEDKEILRKVIEDVKNNDITEETIINFKKLLDKKSYNVLGCTEFPLIYFQNIRLFDDYKIIDTEEITIKYLVRYMKYEK